MRCEILYGPEAGTIKHFPNNDPTAHTLIRAGALRLVETEPGEMVKMPNGQVIPKMGPVVQPRWSVGSIVVTSACDGFSQNDVGTRVPALVYEGLNQKLQWIGQPMNICFGRPVPEDILNEYAKARAAYWKDRQ
jgi:hypothetical protein